MGHSEVHRELNEAYRKVIYRDPSTFVLMLDLLHEMKPMQYQMEKLIEIETYLSLLS